MTDPTVSFYLGSFSDHPEFGDLSIAPERSDVRVKRDKENYSKIQIGNVTYTTNDLLLELCGDQWFSYANFDIPEFETLLENFRDAVAEGKAILNLGRLEYLSNKEDNFHLFE